MSHYFQIRLEAKRHGLTMAEMFQKRKKLEAWLKGRGIEFRRWTPFETLEGARALAETERSNDGTEEGSEEGQASPWPED